MRRIAFALLFVLVFTIPWEAAVVFAGFGTLSRAIGLGAAGFGFLAVLGTGQFRPLKVMHFAMGLLVLWIFLSLMWTRSEEIGITRVVTFVQLAGFAWLIWEFAASRSRQVLLMQAYVLGGCVALLMQLMSSADVALLSRIGVPRLAGGGLNVNDFALSLLITIPFALFIASRKEGKSKVLRLASWVYCPIAAFGVFMTGSRTAFLIVLVMVLLLVVAHLRRPLFALLVVATVGIFIVKLPEWMPPATLKRLTSVREAFASRQDTWRVRRNIWTAGVRVSSRNPIIGTGTGSFETVASEQFPTEMSNEASAHNAYLRVLVELGAVGSFLFGIVLLTAAAYALGMPGAERFLWLIILVAWGLGAVTLNIEDRKLLWFLLGLLTSQYVTVRQELLLSRVRKLPMVRRLRRLPVLEPG